jgi:hypothetical protein
MKPLSYILVIFLILIINLSFVSSNFVCGFVNNSQEFSSSWANVVVYFEENKSDFTECKINPENKFCCDLDNISSVNFSVGKKVFAEVFDEKSGFVAGPVSLYLTDAGYDVFPEMKLEKALTATFSDKNIVVNKSSILINLSLAEKYNNLKYVLNSSEGYLEQEVCKNCTDFEFLVPLFKGKNELVLISNGSREISEKIVFYNLDYFNFNVDISCDKCKLKKKFFYVPSGEDIRVYSSFNSSHNISGDFLSCFPSQWVLLDSLKAEDFSVTHECFREQIINKKEFSVDYVVKTPKTFIKQDYIFYQKLNEYDSLTKIRVFKFKLIPFHKINSFEKNYSDEALAQRTSPEEPIVLSPKEDYLKLVAIFPKQEVLESYSDIRFETEKSGKEERHLFTILTTLSNSEIDRIFLIFNVKKGKSIEIYTNDGSKRIDLEVYEESSNYTSYSVSVNEKGPFQVRIF